MLEWYTVLVCWAAQFLHGCCILQYYYNFTVVLFRKSLYNAVFYGIMNGFSDGIFYFLYAVLFRYGAFAVTVDSDHVAFVNYRELLMLVPSM